MPKIFALFLILLLIKINSADKNTIPLFILDYKNVMEDLVVNQNPLAKTPSVYLTEIMHDCIKRSDVVIIFVEESFCVEDVTIKDEFGTPYKNLQAGLQDNIVKYYPRIKDSYVVLNNIFRRDIFNTFYLNSKTVWEDMFTDQFNYYFIFKYFYVIFEDESDVTRAEALRRHDMLMKEVSQVICKLTAGAVIAIYTGMVNPVNVEPEFKVKNSSSTISPPTAAVPPPPPLTPPRDDGVMIDTEVALFRFIGMSKSSVTRRSTFNEVPVDVRDTWDEERLATKLAYEEFELEFNFGFEDNDWLLDKVVLLEDGTEVGRTAMGVGAPWSWSYYCGEPLTVVNKRDGSSVTIMEYQIQPFRPLLSMKMRAIGQENTDDISFRSLSGYQRQDTFNAANDDSSSSDDENITRSDQNTSDSDQNEIKQKSKCFGHTVNCGPYFNTHILSGLIVSALCLWPLAFGIYFLYNCKTHDKNDEPHRHRHRLVLTPEWCECCKCAWECCKCALEWCKCSREGCNCAQESCICADEGCQYPLLTTTCDEVTKWVENAETGERV